MKGIDLAEICITSGGDLVEGEAPAGAFTLPDVAGVARRAGAGDRARSARAAGRCWRRSASRPGIR